MAGPVFTYADALTEARFVMLPFLLYAIVTELPGLAIVTFLAMIATDLVDGRIARMTGQSSAFGGAFDSTVDFAVIYSMFTVFFAIGVIPWWKWIVIFVPGLLMQLNLIMQSYLTIIAVLLVTMVLTVWKVKEQPLRSRPPFNLREFVAGFWVDPRWYPDFAWLFVSRFLSLMGFYTLLDFIQFFMRDYLHIGSAKQSTGLLTAAVIVGSLLSAYAAGTISDRVGRRGIVSVSTLLMGAMLLVFLTAPSFHLMLALGLLFGIGFGAWTSVDWALAIDVLPSQEAAGKDLGIWGISATLPQVVGPLIGGPLLDAVNRMSANRGYVALFVIGAAYFVISSFTIWKIKKVR